MIKRSLTAIIGLPLVLVIFIFGNKYIIDIAVSILAICGIHEYMKSISHKFKPVYWVGYVVSIGIAFIHIFPMESILEFLPLIVLMILTVLFIHVVFTDMKYSFVDIGMTFFGIVYVVGLFMFISLLYGYEKEGIAVGKVYIAYLFLATWGCDVFAYLIGRKFGKHKFSKISPKKSIEGCIAGTISGVVLVVLAGFLFERFGGIDTNYIVLIIAAILINVLGQIGDFSASSIKRYSEIKDFSNLLPGHGGIIDRFDSVMLSAPFAYYILTMLM